MKRRALLAALAALACLPALPVQAADTLGAIAARLADAQVMRGRFEQKRQLAGFTNPLVSRGDFVLVRERGLAWTTREPIVSSLLVTPKELVVRGADGKVQQRLAADEQPAMRVVGESMIAVLRGDLSALSRRFALDAKLAGKDGWALTLTPTDSGIRRVFARIELSGDRFVRSIRLEEAGGDTTQIRLIEAVAAPRLSAAEAQRFE
ncbi:outer membrane lipoprotein carrier protein LolA [Cupriavidus sp. amp6]|uniref:outer membrane lipoprotein carrier protein LolA n=1 Tax=Cupriavidus sp. amp6 TaxID=388051 RepID=UPI0004192C77|nr:outer membrane lipoprotein carrier protein LolA [Cupriavidus sp. amp6]